MNLILTIAAGVALGLFLTASIVAITIAIRVRWKRQRRQVLYAGAAFAFATPLAMAFWYAGTWVHDAYLRHQDKLAYRRQVQDAKAFCASAKSRLIEEFVKPDTQQRPSILGAWSEDSYYPLDLSKWHYGTLYNAIMARSRAEFHPSGQLAMCGYLGALTQSELDDARSMKQRNQAEYDSKQREACKAYANPKPIECLRFRPSLDELFKR